jgi:hypothetical protein
VAGKDSRTGAREDKLIVNNLTVHAPITSLQMKTKLKY